MLSHFPIKRERRYRREVSFMELDLDKLTAFRVLGRGAMGTVFLVVDHSADSPSSPFALKVVEKHPTAATRPDTDRRARWEVSVLSHLAHPFLPTLLGFIETPDFLAWALPFCPGGDLNALRHGLPDRIFSTAALRFYLSEVVAALAYLHSLGIVYRDLKPENLLLRADGHLTLSDFDLSRHLPPRPSPSPLLSPSPSHLNPPDPHVRSRHRRNLTRIVFPGGTDAAVQHLKKAKSARVSPVSRRRASIAGGGGGERSHSFVGTEEYVAPEVVRGDGHEFAVDWWALGVLAYEMTFGRTPFRGRDRKETFRNVLTRQPEFGNHSRRRTHIEDLIVRLLAKDPERRLGSAGGAEEVKAHPFFNGMRWDLLADVARPPFLPEDYDVGATAGNEGFDIMDYFNKLRQRQAGDAAAAPSVSINEF